MLEENSTVTVSEIVVCPTVIFDCFHEVKRPMINRLNNINERVKMCELLTKKKTHFFQSENKKIKIQSDKNVMQEKFKIYSLDDSVESDVKEVSDFMHTYIK